MSTPITISRRNFIKTTFTTTAGLTMGISLGGCDNINFHSGKNQSNIASNLWIRVSTENIVTITVAESDMGQGVRTSLPMLVAEELEADWNAIQIEQAQPLPTYGGMSTGGSTSVRDAWEKLRIAGASMRQILIAAAADKWGVPTHECFAENSKVFHKSSKRNFNYGDLVESASHISLPRHVQLKKPADFKLIGKSLASLDGTDKVTGKAIYGSDIDIPHMLIATIAHCPVFGGKLKAFNADKAKMINGVKDIIQIESGIAVVAEHFWAAKKGVEALDIEWETGSLDSVNSASIRKTYINALNRPGVIIYQQGQNTSFTDSAGNCISVSYESPFQAHATMEPMNCTVRITDELYEIWAPTQSPTGAQYVTNKLIETPTVNLARRIQKKLGIRVSFDNIKIYTTLLGGGFGRRLKQDYIAEAVQIAKAAKRPVKLIWTREEDMQHDYYRPYTMHSIDVKVDNNQLPEFWRHHIVGPEKNRSAGGAEKIPYSIPNIEIQYTHIDSQIPTGSWRSVGFSHNTFILESTIDELATKSQQHPLEYRLKLLEHEPRGQQVLQLVTNLSGWLQPAEDGHHFGVAFFKGFGSYIAQVVELSFIQTLKIHKVTCVVDCGLVINPNTVEAQIEGGIVFGLTAALKSMITIHNGRVSQSNFHNFPLLTIDEMPEILVKSVQSNARPGGIGELAVPPLAPAVANALFSATGKRFRILPISKITL